MFLKQTIRGIEKTITANMIDAGPALLCTSLLMPGITQTQPLPMRAPVMVQLLHIL